MSRRRRHFFEPWGAMLLIVLGSLAGCQGGGGEIAPMDRRRLVSSTARIVERVRTSSRRCQVEKSRPRSEVTFVFDVRKPRGESTGKATTLLVRVDSSRRAKETFRTTVEKEGAAPLKLRSRIVRGTIELTGTGGAAERVDVLAEGLDIQGVTTAQPRFATGTIHSSSAHPEGK